MGKRKAKPLLAVQGVVHLSESFVQPSQESGLLSTVDARSRECGLILAPNYGYAISASALSKQTEETDVKKTEEESSGDRDTENAENETPAGHEVATETADTDVSVAELVRQIGGAKGKPLRGNDIVDDRPESPKPQKPQEKDDPETAKFYESLGIARPSNEPNEVRASSDAEERCVAMESGETEVDSVSESIAEFYKNYPTQYVYSVSSDPYGNEPLQFSLPTVPSEVSESSPSIVDIARRAQRAKRAYELRKKALDKAGGSEEEAVYDPLPLEVIPSSTVTGPSTLQQPNLTTYWDYVQVNPYDFNRWSFLITFAESTGVLEEIRRVYSAFLPLFPYCFAYWKRYSDVEKGHNYLHRALRILERGLEFNPLSVDLWMSHLHLFAEIHTHHKDFEMLMRQQYELGVRRCGMGFRSDTLWESFIQWEMSLGKTRNVFVLYKQLLQVPTRLYNRHWDNCGVLIRDYHPRDILCHDDYESLRKKGCRVLGLRYKAEPDIEPGEIRKTKKPEDKLMDFVKERVLDKLRKVHSATAQEADKRWDFEDKIKRPYFHVKPLDKAQLWNWEQYLNFEMSEGNHDRIVLLFERCLVACANYERFWVKYGRYLEKFHRSHPEVEGSAHVQGSEVGVGIGCAETAEEEEIVSGVEWTVNRMVTLVEEAEEEEETILRGVVESLLRGVEWEVDGVSGHVEGHNGKAKSDKELGGLGGSDGSFVGLMRVPAFGVPRLRWHRVVRDVYTRASLHCPLKPMIRVQWAGFEEDIGNVDGACELLNHVLEWHPSFLEAKLQMVDLERRRGKVERVVELYEQLLSTSTSKDAFSLVSMKYARFLFKEMGLAEKGLHVLRRALKKDSGNHRLYAQVYEMCYHRFPQDKKGAYAALELAARADKLSRKHKLVFLRKRVHFLQEHGQLDKYRDAVDDMYELEGTVRQEEEETKRWSDFESGVGGERREVSDKSLEPFPVPTTPRLPETGSRILFESLDEPPSESVVGVGETDVGPSVPYGAVPPVQEFLHPNYGYGGKHPDVRLADNLAHKDYEAIEAKGYPQTVKDTPEDLELLKQRKRNNPLYIIPPRGSFYANSLDPDGLPLAKRLRLEAPVLLSDLITPNSAPCVNVPDWFVQEGGELCLSETPNGFSVLRYWPHFLSEDGNMKMFKSLRKSVKWHQKQILTSFGTWRHVPRLISWLGPCEYAHTGLVMNKCEDWTPEILDLLHRLVQLVNYEFNSCSLNLYRTGHDSNAWHADIHPALGSNPPIASVSLGALRTFEMKRKGLHSTNFIRFPLFPGSLLIMEGATQTDWLHQVPKEPGTKGERLNLTFRIMHALKDEDPFERKDEGVEESKDQGTEESKDQGTEESKDGGGQGLK